MTYQEINVLHEKAKAKKDGVYSFRGVFYAVKCGHFVAFAEFSGECYQRNGAFNVRIGQVHRHERKKALKKWLNEQK